MSRRKTEVTCPAGEVILRYREKMGWTQRDFAVKVLGDMKKEVSVYDWTYGGWAPSIRSLLAMRRYDRRLFDDMIDAMEAAGYGRE